MRWLSDLVGTKAASFAVSFLKLTPQSTPATPPSGSVWVDGTSNRLSSYDGATAQQYVTVSDLAGQKSSTGNVYFA